MDDWWRGQILKDQVSMAARLGGHLTQNDGHRCDLVDAPDATEALRLSLSLSFLTVLLIISMEGSIQAILERIVETLLLDLLYCGYE